MDRAVQGRFSVGQTYRAHFAVDASTVERFAEFSGDRNPLHLDIEEAKTYGYPRQVAHGGILTAFLSKLIGSDVPGPGALWMSQSVVWLSPLFVGDEVEFVVTVRTVSTGVGVLGLDVTATNQRGKTVMKGEATVKIGERVAAARATRTGTDRIVLVTGGSRGIGAGIARRLGTTGAVVAVNYRQSRDAATEVVDGIQAAGGRARAFEADLDDSQAASDMIREIVGAFGRLDVVVHGATPAVQTTNLTDLRYGDVERYLKTYVSGALTLVSSTSPGMCERKFGRFIFLGTSWLFGMPPAGFTGYVIAKQALWGLVKCLATELGPFGITSNMVSPGVTVTDLTADMSTRVKELEARKSPMRRLATAEDTAELVAFLASDGAGYLNGANFPVTGGPVAL